MREILALIVICLVGSFAGGFVGLAIMTGLPPGPDHKALYRDVVDRVADQLVDIPAR